MREPLVSDIQWETIKPLPPQLSDDGVTALLNPTASFPNFRDRVAHYDRRLDMHRASFHLACALRALRFLGR